MKTLQDVKTCLKMELIHWYGIQACSPLAPFYCYYRKGTRQANSGLMIARQVPSRKHHLVQAERVNGYHTIDWNFNKLMKSLVSLPVLDPG